MGSLALGLTVTLHVVILGWLFSRDESPAITPAQPVLNFSVTLAPAAQPRPPRMQQVAPPRPAPTVAAATPESTPDSAPQPMAQPTAPPAQVAAAPPAVITAAPEPETPAHYDARYADIPNTDYPARARRLGQQGKVILRVEIAADGHPIAARVISSSGYTLLDEAASAYVLRWVFQPARRGATAIASAVDVPIVFSLH